MDAAENPATKLAIELGECSDKIDALSEQLAKLNKEYEAREAQLIEQYDMQQIKSIKVLVNGKPRAIGRSKKFFARRKDGIQPEQVYDAVIKDGLSFLAQRSVNANSLTAYLKTHLNQEGASLPPHLAEVIDAKEYPSISIRAN